MAVSERLHKLPVAQGALEPAIGRLGEQCTGRRLVAIELYSLTSFAKQRCSRKRRTSFASHLIGNGVRDQPAKRSTAWAQYPSNGTAPQAIGYLAQQRRLVEPRVAMPFRLTENPILQ